MRLIALSLLAAVAGSTGGYVGFVIAAFMFADWNNGYLPWYVPVLGLLSSAFSIWFTLRLAKALDF